MGTPLIVCNQWWCGCVHGVQHYWPCENMQLHLSTDAENSLSGNTLYSLLNSAFEGRNFTIVLCNVWVLCYFLMKHTLTTTWTIADWYRIHTTSIMSKGVQTFPGFPPYWKLTSSSDNWPTLRSAFLAHDDLLNVNSLCHHALEDVSYYNMYHSVLVH